MDRRGLMAFACMCLGITLSGCAARGIGVDGSGGSGMPTGTVSLCANCDSLANPAKAGFTVGGSVTNAGRLSLLVRPKACGPSGPLPPTRVLHVSIPLAVGQTGEEVATRLAAALKSAIPIGDTTLVVAVAESSVGVAARFAPSFFFCDTDPCAAGANDTDLGVTVHGLDIRTTESEVLALPKPTRTRGLQLSVLKSEGSRATLIYSLAHGAEVSLGVFDVAGRRIRTLVRGNVPAGTHTVAWDGLDGHGSRVSSGVYFYRLVVAGRYVDRRGILMK